MNPSITIKDTVLIKASRETVWEYTQNPDMRNEWDSLVMQCKIQQQKPNKIIRLKMIGGIITNLTYKLCKKPMKTSLKLTETRSWWFKGGGGSWTYNEVNNQTEWTQINTLIFKHRLIYWLFSKLTLLIFKKVTSRSMHNAKKRIENNTIKS